MRDFIDFFAQCAQSGTLLTSLCAIVVIPLTAWVACRFVAPHVVHMADDPTWQAPLAALAAGLPAALFVALSMGALLDGMASACLTIPAGRVIFGLIIALMAVALVRAVWLATARADHVRRLIRCSAEPSQRLGTAALSCGLKAREVMEDAPICVLAGFTSPVVLVSTGALRALSNAELRAALYHERAHARRGDQLLAGVLSFLVDLLPLPASDLIQTYHTARELAADSVAAGAAGVDNLAGALLQFAKAGRAPVGVASLVDNRPASVRSRLQALLEKSAPVPRVNGVRRIAIAAVLSVIASGGIVAPVAAHRPPGACAMTMSVHR